MNRPNFPAGPGSFQDPQNEVGSAHCLGLVALDAIGATSCSIKSWLLRRTILKKLATTIPMAILLSPMILSAQLQPKPRLHGCTDSPENPTAVLGLVVGAAGLGIARLRHRLGKQKTA
jgi:hypothetical protein